MAFLPGRRLGPYEILTAIGAGGMDEVYRARDIRLDRTVAIKVLPTHLADRSELRERFEREAKTIASLNHPHICTLYDIGQQDGVDYLVMEYLEGETLAQRLQKGALPIRMVWVSRNGIEQALIPQEHAFSVPRLSPDSKRIAVNFTEQDNQMRLYDLSRETLTRFTFEGTTNLYPAWSPDGKRIAFQSNKEGPLNVFLQLSDGTGGLERLTTSDDVQFPNSWSPDGQLLAFTDVSPTTGYDIWILSIKDRKAQPFLRTPFSENAPRFSPDGRWIAYVSDESGRLEIYVQPYPGPGGKWQISTEGGNEPVWNPNGRELFYRVADKMMGVDIATQPSFAAGKPHILFERPYATAAQSVPNYDVSPDGQRFLMLKLNEAQEAAPTQINVVLNWFEESKQKVPTGKK
jgi:Tol biopolymer transport system component